MNMISNIFSNKIVKRVAEFVLVIAIIAGGVYLVYKFKAPIPSQAPTNFQECAAKYPITGENPKTCKVPFGPTYYEYTGNQNVVENEIRLTNLLGAPVLSTSPVTVNGEAIPAWFGQSGIVIQLVSADGAVIGSATAQPQDAIPATAGFKAFSVTITFNHPKDGSVGAIVLKKAGSDTTSVEPVAF